MMDDLLDLLGVPAPEPTKGRKRPGVTVECGQTPPREAPKRFTEWNNVMAFEFGGYLARVRRHHCGTCDALWDELEGVFIEERHLPSGSRRLTALAPNGDWPAQGGHRKEVAEVEDRMCGECIGELGFDREVDARGQPYTLVAGVGRVK